ncbi:MAG TPA: glycosyl hydrolase, partial [Candidatus Hydrogenedentes bacterium]|nr:glycosyl hydrolase [Candidatus Hydrogenedentota bacterium]
MRVPPETILDLSANMNDSGRLVWDAPAGNWTVLRMGHTCTGVENMPSPASGRGLECDKLSREGIEAQWAGMMGPLVADAGPLAGKALAATHIDSWENGAQNWTPRMREEFRKRRGYDLFPWLPVMTGRVVGSLELSERFLWDLRRTVADLVEENYAGRLRELAAAHGMRLTIEAYGGPCDDQPYAGRCDEPMGEFWIGGSALTTCRAMASAAHTRGMRVVGAEAFTAGDHEKWQEHPGSIKPLGDRAFCEGINRFVFHRYALQPWADRRPGMTMGPWGIHYERTQTWWEWTPAWHQYLARCQHLLRQGLFVADICHVQPEAAPQGFNEHPRAGYDYDVCGADVVLRDMSVRDGRLILPDGMSYRVLALSGADVMTPELLRKVGELVKAGATVIGPKPVKSPSLSGYPECDREVARLAAEIWGDCDGRAVKERRHGAGRVVWGITPEGLLAGDGVPPDFLTHARLNWIHRVDGDADFWFVANPHAYPVAESCAFRVAGKHPELWHPDTGAMERAGAFLEADGVTRVPLSLPPGGSVFVVFRPAPAGADPVAALARNGEALFTAVSTGPKVEIVRAVYGVQGDAAKCRDARAEVQRRVDVGEYALRVAALAEEGDPADGAYKTLVVEYTLDGKPLSVSGGD